MPDHVIAKRSKYIVVTVVLYWVMAGIFTGLAIGLMFVESGIRFTLMIFSLFFIPFAIIFSYHLSKTPPVLAEMRGGVLYLYPDRKTCIPVNPLDIRYTSHQIYNPFLVGWAYTRLVAKLIVDTTSGRLVLPWVRGYEEARQKLEWLRTEASRVA